MQNTNPMEKLFQSLQQRKRPEDIAQIILELLQERLTKKEKALLQKAAGGSLKRRFFAYTSMLEDFAGPFGLANQINVASRLFTYPTPPDEDQCDNPEVVTAYIKEASQRIRKQFGQNDFKADRKKEGESPTRKRMDHNPLNRKEYLLHVHYVC